MKKYILLLFLTVLLSACFRSTNENAQKLSVNDTLCENVEIIYASHLKISKFNDYYLAEIRNPWDTSKILHSYIIVDNNSKKNIENQENYTLVKSPIKNALVFTSLHSHLMKELGCINSIGAVCDADYILDADIKNAISDGKIKNLGSSMAPDIEKIIVQNPDAIFVSPFENYNGYGMMSKVKSPIIECADYMETSPLGQAEWIKFYGLLLGQFRMADSIFSAVEKEYNDLKNKMLAISYAPSLLANTPMSGTWYMPTGKSTAGEFYSDAGSNYLFSYLDGFGSKPLDFETVFAKAHDADIWVFKYNAQEDFSLKTFANENPKFQNFKAFKDKQVYGCNLNYSPFYDEIPFHPELNLKELVKICHPSLLNDYELRYYKLLQ